MSIKMIRLLFLSCAAAAIFAIEVSSLDLNEELQKQVPFYGNIPVASNLNVTWLRSKDMWYFPFITRSSLLLWTKNFVDETEYQEMSEDYAREKSCFGQNWKEDFEHFGFGNNFNTENWKLKFDPVRKGVVDWEYKGVNRATTYFMITDNDSFVVGLVVSPDGNRGGFVMTPYNYDASSRFTKDQISTWEKAFEEVGFEKESLIELSVNCAEKFWEDLKSKRYEEENNADKLAELDAADSSENEVPREYRIFIN